MVPKENGFNQSEKGFRDICVRIVWRLPCSPVMARDVEVIQSQHFCHHGDTIFHPKSGYVLITELQGTSDATIMRYFQTELISRFLPSA